MSLKVRLIEHTGERWAQGMTLHGLETWEGVASMATWDKVLWMVAPRLRRVSHRSKQTACITIPTVLLRHTGAKVGEYLELIPRRGGELIIRKASERKVRNALSRFQFLRADVESRRKAIWYNGTGY